MKSGETRLFEMSLFGGVEIRLKTTIWCVLFVASSFFRIALMFLTRATITHFESVLMFHPVRTAATTRGSIKGIPTGRRNGSL